MAKLMTLNVAHAAVGPIPPWFHPRATLERRLAAVAAVLAEASPDLVALQEVDRPTRFSKHFDHFARIAAVTGMHPLHAADRVDPSVHPRPGTALLSRAPLGAVRALAFQAGPLDDKSFVAGTARIDGLLVDVASVHLDPFSSATRRRQIAAMERALGPRDRPRVVMGDMNSWWSGDVARLAVALDVAPFEPDEAAQRTFPSFFPVVRLDWILVSQELAVVSCVPVCTIVSDHLGVFADVRAKG